MTGGLAKVDRLIFLCKSRQNCLHEGKEWGRLNGLLIDRKTTFFNEINQWGCGLLNMTTSLFLLCRRERLLAFLFIFGLLLTTEAQGPGQQVQQPPPQIHKRFEYKYSFKPPYLAQKDGTVPFFEYSGSEY